MSVTVPEKPAVQRTTLRAMLGARQAALPTEHGSWVFLFVPLAVGLVVGGLRPESGLLAFTALAGFLARQPVTLLVKAVSGRRPKTEMKAGLFWLAVYGLAASAGAVGLAASGLAFLIWLAIPAIPVLGWHLWLVSRRAERKQAVVEIAGSGVLALAVTAAYWTGLGRYDPSGWLLWGLCWEQAAGTILHAYLRLEQRRWKSEPDWKHGLRTGAPALAYNLILLAGVIGLAEARVLPAWLPLAFAVQPLETGWGILRPAVGVKPAAVGIRQMIVSILFGVVFMVTWGMG